MSYKSVILDFDGTICDTGEGVMKSVKYALDSFNIASPEWNELTCFIGPPLVVSFKERFNVSDDEANVLVEKFRERYRDIGILECSIYQGMKKTLNSLKSHGIKLGIASSKPQQYIEKILNNFGMLNLFDYIGGVSFGSDCETKASIISRCREVLGTSIEETVVVGDRKFDLLGAAENNIDSCGALWGYGSKEEFEKSNATFILEKVEDIEAVALGFFEQTTLQEPYLNGRIINVHVDTVKLCDKSVATRETVDHPGGVGICALTANKEVLLVRQFRYPYKEVIYEIPAGKLEKCEDPKIAAMREFEEECGAKASNFFSLGELYPTPGYCGEIIRMYGASDLTFTEQRLDEDEFLEVIRMPLEECIEKIMSGEIKDSKTICAIMKMNYLIEHGKAM